MVPGNPDGKQVRSQHVKAASSHADPLCHDEQKPRWLGGRDQFMLNGRSG